MVASVGKRANTEAVLVLCIEAELQDIDPWPVSEGP